MSEGLDWYTPGGMQINPMGNEAKERAKFEQFPSLVTIHHGVGNPYVYRPYPKTLFKAGHFQGKVVCMAAPPCAADYKDMQELTRAEAQANNFNNACTKIVADDLEHSRATEDGWRDSPQEAVDHAMGVDKRIANAAAERAFDDRNMGEKAKAEVDAAVQAVGGEHIPEMVEQPKRKGGWPKGKKRGSQAVA